MNYNGLVSVMYCPYTQLNNTVIRTVTHSSSIKFTLKQKSKKI